MSIYEALDSRFIAEDLIKKYKTGHIFKSVIWSIHLMVVGNEISVDQKVIR